MEELIGQVINNFEIQAIIGQGGMGIVYRAFHPELQSYAAVKIMRPELATQPGFYQRFLQEARTAARLDHPNIVDVFNFGRHEHSYYLMMDYVEGPNLRQVLKEHDKGLPLYDALEIFAQIAGVLGDAHAAGILHRDLKPDNILLARSHSPAHPYRVIVTDFGLVKLAANSLLETQEGISVGTPAYMSPEQCQGKGVDARTDIYSLGVMFYEVITGQRPYPIRTLFDANQYHQTGKLRPLRSLRLDAPVLLDALVQRMLNPAVEQRPATAREVTQALQTVMASLDKKVSQLQARIVGSAPEPVITPTVTPLADDTPRQETRARFHIRVTFEGQAEPRLYALGDLPLIVGRQAPAAIVLDRPGQRFVSKQHCEILRRGDRVFIRDLHSMNGTLLEDQKLQPDRFYPWTTERVVQLGPFALELADTARPQPLPSPPAAEGENAVTASATVIGDTPAVFTLRCPDATPPQLLLGETTIRLGRAPDCDVRFHHPHVSKYHCQVQRKGNAVEVTDLGSTNGTFLQERRLETKRPVAWQPGVSLRLGPFIVTLETAG